MSENANTVNPFKRDIITTKRLAIVTSGIELNRPNFLSNVINILHEGFSGEVLVFTARVFRCEESAYDKRVRTIQVMPEQNKNPGGVLQRILTDILVQIKLSYSLLTEKPSEVYVFYCAQSLLLPVLTLKLLRRRVALVFGIFISKLVEFEKDPLLKILKIEEKINLRLADRLVVYSENLIADWSLDKYRTKTTVAPEHFINVEQFKIENSINQRDNVIGYIGRLKGQKGILNFLESIPKVLRTRGDVRFLIGGDGPMRTEVERYLSDHNLNDKVDFVGWIDHETLPSYLNNLKLIVFPSNTEGLPNIMLEAMACGTPVVVTPVDAIPSIIKDGQTGFILKDNSPDCVYQNIIKALEHPNLEDIVIKARDVIERLFVFRSAVAGYQRALIDFLKTRDEK